jgi:hypothetical protein
MVTTRAWPPPADEAVLTACPASTRGEPATPAPDCPFNIEFTGRSRVEAILDFSPHPAKLLTAALLMPDCGNDGGLAAAIEDLRKPAIYVFSAEKGCGIGRASCRTVPI